MKKLLRYKQFIGWLIIAIVAVYFARTLARNWEQVSELSIGISYQTILAIIFFTMAVIASGNLWGMIFNRISGKEVSQVEAVRSHLAAWLLKYVPGQVGAFVYKIQWGKLFGVNRNVTAVAFAYETLFLTLASTVLVIPILLITLGDRTGSSLFVIYVITLLGVLLSSRKTVVKGIVKFMQKLTGKHIQQKYILGLKEMSVYTAWFSVPRIINAIGFVALTASILPVTPAMYVPLGAAYILAGIVGIYAIFVPSGLGVREAVIVAFASAYFSTEQAIVAALLARLYATIADGIVALLYAYLTHKKKGIVTI